jgi:hypothetical protein
MTRAARALVSVAYRGLTQGVFWPRRQTEVRRRDDNDEQFQGTGARVTPGKSLNACAGTWRASQPMPAHWATMQRRYRGDGDFLTTFRSVLTIMWFTGKRMGSRWRVAVQGEMVKKRGGFTVIFMGRGTSPWRRDFTGTGRIARSSTEVAHGRRTRAVSCGSESYAGERACID